MEYFKFRNEPNYSINTESNLFEEHEGERVPVEQRVRLSYGKDPKHYLEEGESQVKQMLNILKDFDCTLPEGSKILDFGCSSGRMLRWLPKLAPGCEYWGCDAESKAIVWGQMNLDKKLKLFTSVKEPHLPFEDSSLDLIYAGSVFSHIDDLADIWFLELRRIIKPSGLLYLTFQDENSLRIINGKHSPATQGYYQRLYEDNNLGEHLETDYSKIVIGKSEYSSQVFYKQDWLKEHLSRYFSSCTMVNEAYGWQTAAVLKK